MDGGAWQAKVHRVTKSQTQLSDLTHSFTIISTTVGRNPLEEME